MVGSAVVRQWQQLIDKTIKCPLVLGYSATSQMADKVDGQGEAFSGCREPFSRRQKAIRATYRMMTSIFAHFSAEVDLQVAPKGASITLPVRGGARRGVTSIDGGDGDHTGHAASAVVCLGGRPEQA